MWKMIGFSTWSRIVAEQVVSLAEPSPSKTLQHDVLSLLPRFCVFYGAVPPSCRDPLLPASKNALWLSLPEILWLEGTKSVLHSSPSAIKNRGAFLSGICSNLIDVLNTTRVHLLQKVLQ